MILVFVIPALYRLFIRLPLGGIFSCCTIEWGDGTQDNTTMEHIYNSKKEPQQFVVCITDSFTSFGTTSMSGWPGSEWLIQVVSFHPSLVSLEGAFRMTPRLVDLPSQMPPGVYTIAYMFYQSRYAGNHIASWNTENITDMSFLFCMNPCFNTDIHGWNTSRVENMRSMFSHATSFNQPIGSWDVSHVKNMNQMFCCALKFQQSLSDWNIKKETDISHMFQSAISFDLDSWNQSQIKPNPSPQGDGRSLIKGKIKQRHVSGFSLWR
jgi:hypothetical protein